MNRRSRRYQASDHDDDPKGAIRLLERTEVRDHIEVARIRWWINAIVGIAVFGICTLAASAAQAQTNPTTTTTTLNNNPGLKLTGSGAEGFVFAIVGVLVFAIFFPVVYNALSATRVQRRQQRFVRKLLMKPKGGGNPLSTDDVVKIMSAYGKLPGDSQGDSQGAGGQSLTTSLLALATLALVGLALVLLFVSSSSDAADLRKTIITALLSILASISGFYFGARTAQVSAHQAQSSGESDSAPKFTQASPPPKVAIGDSYNYHFVASGTPAPTYQLLDGPSDWLKLDSATGFVSGTVPDGQKPFNFSVVAHNRAGSVKAGPFPVTLD